MSYDVRILADSIANDQRITTAELVFPRFILAEVNTHRMFSRNSASSRAIPTEKIIERVQNEPFIPETFNRRVKGMGVGEELSAEHSEMCYWEWLNARDAALDSAEYLLAKEVDKSRVNRLLEPFMWHTAIITATDWDNFFALRNHKDAQPEFRKIANMLQEAMDEHEPLELEEDEWHLPLVDESEFIQANATEQWEYFAWVSAGRCARSSYDKVHDPESKNASYARAEKLKAAGHMSPFEHQARPFSEEEMDRLDKYENIILTDSELSDELAWSMYTGIAYSGNFKYWHQFRKSFMYEDNYAKINALQ